MTTRPRGWARPWLLSALLYTAIAVAVTWPLAARLGAILPVGRVRAATVAYLNLWTLEWNADRLLHGYRGYFDAPIFAPARSALLLSEPQGATGLVFAPLSWAFGGVAAYGLVLLLALITTGLAMRRCVKLAGGSELAATACGALATALPFALEELGVLQLTVLAPPLMALAEVIAVFSAPSPARLPRAATWLAVTLWSCEYYALFLILLLLPAAVLALRDPRARAAVTVRSLALSALVLAVPAAPLVLAQHEALHAYPRAAETIRKGSLGSMAYLRPAPGSVAWQLLVPLRTKGNQRSAYPGLVLLGCAALGAREGMRGDRKRVARLILALGLVALLVAFGTKLRLGELRPYALIRDFVPGFAELRSPYRMVAFVQLSLVMLAGFGLDALRRAPPRLRGHALDPRALSAALVALWLIETVPQSQSMHPFPHEALREPWVGWLSRQPSGRVAMLPSSASGDVKDFEAVALAMLQGLVHGQPLVDGYSGFFPPLSRVVRTRGADFPEPRAIGALRLVEVRYAVVKDAWRDARVAATKRAAPLPVLFAAHGTTVYGVPSGSQ